jgi:N6-L-threonylcarbamoyladenine synthase
MLLVSGGHCQFLIVRARMPSTRLGGTIDDAPGEAFDKAARLLGLPQPGGPAVERGGGRAMPAASPFRVRFSTGRGATCRSRASRPRSCGPGTRWSRSRAGSRSRTAPTSAPPSRRRADVLAEKSRRALAEAAARGPLTGFAVAGGVAANRAIRAGLESVSREAGVPFLAPPLALCTDNAAMIAWAGIERLALGLTDGFDLAARPRWPLDASQPALLGSGKKGAKA